MKLRIREARERIGISLPELSRRSGIAKSTLFYMELNATDPKVSSICKIAGALGVPPASLFSCED